MIMNDVVSSHKKKIAKDTLKMTPVAASILGGMTFPEAYKLVFRTDLVERLARLIEEYGDCQCLSWELEMYGWNTPQELQAALHELTLQP